MKLSGSHCLIFDSYTTRTKHLKARLIREGASVSLTHSILVALQHVECRKLDAVFIPYRSDAGTRKLLAEVQRLRIPTIFTGSSPLYDELRSVA
jgi:hypothetical protein